MIGAVAQGANGRIALIFGATAENLRRLTTGEPGYFADGRQLINCPIDVMFIYGETGSDVIRELRRMGLELDPSAEAAAGRDAPDLPAAGDA